MEKKDKKNTDWKMEIKIIARVVQGIFFGVMLLGISLMFGDVMPVIDMPVSPLSATTTIYGFLGMLACEFVARRMSDEKS